MRGRYGASLAVLLGAALGLCAAPPEVPAKLTAKPGQLVRVVVKADPDKLGHTRTFTDSEAFWGELVGPKGTRAFVFQAPSDGTRAEYVVAWWTAGETDGATTTIVIEGVAPIPPGPTPDPKPPEPSGPLRVIFVYESGVGVTLDQQKVMFGEKVRTYLDAKAKGWRRYDKDVSATNEKDADLKALWEASKGKVTAVPCVVVASGTRADIVPLPATEEAALELFRKYEGK